MATRANVTQRRAVSAWVHQTATASANNSESTNAALNLLSGFDALWTSGGSATSAVNSSYATAAGGGISTANDLATWITALVSGKVFNADYHQQWLSSLRAEDPDTPDGQKYGYGISYQRFGPGAVRLGRADAPQDRHEIWRCL